MRSTHTRTHATGIQHTHTRFAVLISVFLPLVLSSICPSVSLPATHLGSLLSLPALPLTGLTWFPCHSLASHCLLLTGFTCNHRPVVQNLPPCQGVGPPPPHTHLAACLPWMRWHHHAWHRHRWRLQGGYVSVVMALPVTSPEEDWLSHDSPSLHCWWVCGRGPTPGAHPQHQAFHPMHVQLASPQVCVAVACPRGTDCKPSRQGKARQLSAGRWRKAGAPGTSWHPYRDLRN